MAASGTEIFNNPSPHQSVFAELHDALRAGRAPKVVHMSPPAATTPANVGTSHPAVPPDPRRTQAGQGRVSDTGHLGQ